MGADVTGSWTDGQDDPPDAGGRAVRQYGTRPVAPRQYGTRPADPRQYGTRPLRQYGTRPYDARQYGTRPVRQYGTRPVRQYGTRPDAPDDALGYLDPDEWSADIAEIFCTCSAVVRLGAQLMGDGGEMPVPSVDFHAAPDYIRPGGPISRARVSQRDPALQPRQRRLATTVSLPTELEQGLVDHPDAAWAVKQDIANALALRADRAFLRGAGGALGPLGVAASAGVVQEPLANVPAPAAPNTPDLLATAREIVNGLRTGPVPFRNAGWVLDPRALARLSGALTTDAIRQVAPPGAGAAPHGPRPRSIDATDVLSYDGRDGGQLLGYPFVVSAAAGGATSMFFSADWAEAWIAVDADLVAVDFSSGARFGMGDLVVRAVMHHDFAVRRGAAFRYTD
jgi:hypothetical protein